MSVKGWAVYDYENGTFRRDKAGNYTFPTKKDAVAHVRDNFPHDSTYLLLDIKEAIDLTFANVPRQRKATCL